MWHNLLAAGITFLAVAAASWPLGLYMARVYEGRPTFLSPVLRPVERSLYWLTGVRETREQGWVEYLVATLAVSFVSLLLTYSIFRLQGHLPLNPQGFPNVDPALSLNTAISFMTNTSWQNYSGEQTLSYVSQALALGLQMFLSAGAGMALAIALVRGFVRREAQGLGNFYVDLIRSILYVLLPLSIVGAVVLASQGVIQNWNSYTVAHTLGGAVQVIGQGPVASQEVIKLMGGDGGGFFNANSAHPFENPNGFTNQLEIFLMMLVPFSLTITFGRMVGNLRQGLTIAGAMWVILLGATVVAAYQEQVGNPALTAAGVAQQRTSQSAGGNMEGKSVRFGPVLSAQFAAAATGSGDGAVDSSHDSMTALGGLVPLTLMKLGEVTPGGPGAGLYGMLVFAIQAVFIGGLMVGRTPEYLGKKIESREMRLIALALLVVPALVLGMAAISVLLPAGRSALGNPGPHGFSEVLYAFASASVNNGSAFAGLSGNTLYYNVMLAIAMWLGRFGIAIPMLALAGSLARKRLVPAGAGTLATDTPLFGAFLIGVVLVMGAVTFLPALALAPVLEHLHMAMGAMYH